MTNTNRPTSTAAGAPDPNDIGAQIAAEMAAAFAAMAQTKAPQRRTPAAETDPWAGVAVNRWSDRERDALTRLGWLQLGWSESRPHAGQRLPAQGLKCGPEMPDPRRVAKGEVDPDGFKVWQGLAMVCTRLQTYGRISVSHVALIFQTMGADPARVGYLESPSRFATKLQQTLKGRVTKTADGHFEATPAGPQAMHDALSRAADLITAPTKSATKAAAKPAAKA
jgi:hypothetical protein